MMALQEYTLMAASMIAKVLTFPFLSLAPSIPQPGGRGEWVSRKEKRGGGYEHRYSEKRGKTGTGIRHTLARL